MSGTEGLESQASRAIVRDDKGRFVPGSGKPRRRRGGGQLGNLNGTRRPWNVFWQRRALRPQDRWVLRLVGGYAEPLVEDKGGADAITAAEHRMVELAYVSRVCLLLALVDRQLPEVRGFIQAERGALTDLGLARRPKPVPGLRELLSQAAQARDGGSAGHAAPSDAGESLPGPSESLPGGGQ